MANGAIAGGIGAGILGGLQFMRQREADARQDQALQNQNQILQMQQQEHGYKVAEQDRKGKMLQGYQKVMAEPGLTDMERYTKFSNEYGQFMTPAEHLEIRKATDPMVQAFGSDALNKAIYSRDLSDLQKVADMRAPGSKIAFSEDGKNLIVSTPDAKQSTMDFNGLAAAYSLRDWQKDQAAKSKSALETRKTEAEIDNIKSKTELNGRLPQDRYGLGLGIGVGRGGGSGGSKNKDGFPFDYKDAEAVAPTHPDTGKADPQKVANLFANAQSMYALNPALRDQPAVFMQIGAGLERGDYKPEPIYDPATNTYFKGVKYGDGAVRIGSESDIDPDKFYGDKPATNSVRLAADRAWLPQYLSSIPDAKQRASIESAVKAETPEGKAARNEIIAAYNKAKASGAEVPLFVSQAYNALRTGDRLKAAPPEKKPASPAQKQTEAPKDFSVSGKPSYEGYINATEQIEKIKADAEKMSPDRREMYLANRLPELEALAKHHSQYLNFR